LSERKKKQVDATAATETEQLTEQLNNKKTKAFFRLLWKKTPDFKSNHIIQRSKIQ